MWLMLPSNQNYAVSNDGQVMSLRKNKILSLKRNHDGYLRVQLWSKNSCKFISVHRLIAEAFLPKPDIEDAVINHKNGDKSDNRVENLEWVTQKENIHHAWLTGLSKSHLNRCGRPVRQLTKQGAFVREYPSTMEVERMLGIPHENISAAIKRQGTAGGFRWEGVVTK